MNGVGPEAVAQAADARARETDKGEIVRNIIAVVLTGLLSADARVRLRTTDRRADRVRATGGPRSWPQPSVKPLDWLAWMEVRVRWADLQQPSRAGILC